MPTKATIYSWSGRTDSHTGTGTRPRPAIDRRLGGHLPRQLANLTEAHLVPKVLYLM
ncbi:MAG: hypothetical protein ACTS6G_04940 [Candidatus Hodgkinia cicadicola]